MCLLPCCAAGAFGAWKVQRSVTKAFESSQPPEPVESGLVTELKLNYNLSRAKTFSGAPVQEKSPGRSLSRPVSKKEADSKARLQALIDEHKNRHK